MRVVAAVMDQPRNLLRKTITTAPLQQRAALLAAAVRLATWLSTKPHEMMGEPPQGPSADCHLAVHAASVHAEALRCGFGDRPCRGHNWRVWMSVALNVVVALLGGAELQQRRLWRMCCWVC